ncbi:MAG: hypothetical protein LVQ96_02650 [Thermoplasmatales archaeon]|nr:hypothetical protein [Thermoplasmatales archaeon]MCW6170050.1 hypothetical protein [Thermoplasmatales archaeon]
MKGSEIRKRYVLVYSSSLDSVLRQMDSNLTKLGCKRKFRNNFYAIYLANQYNRDDVIDSINMIDNVRTIITSGTIKKCKDVMNEDIKRNSV